MTTNCYKCGTEIESTDENFVHELCEDCDKSFMDWFDKEVKSLQRDTDWRD